MLKKEIKGVPRIHLRLPNANVVLYPTFEIQTFMWNTLIMTVFDKIFDFSNESVGDNEAFVKLVQVASEDHDIHKTLISILSLEPFHRQSAISSLIEEMQLKGAPRKFIAAIATLKDDSIAEKALKMLIDSVD